MAKDGRTPGTLWNAESAYQIYEEGLAGADDDSFEATANWRLAVIQLLASIAVSLETIARNREDEL